MDLEQYWALVEKTWPRNNDPETHCEALTRRLRLLKAAEILAFDRIFSQLVDQAYRRDLWSAAYLLNGGCSDDGFTYFRWWLAMQGRDVFELAMSDPESLVEINAGTDDLEWEDYGHLALEAYQEATGEDDFPNDYYSARGVAGKRPQLRGRWIRSDRGLRRKYPMLWRLVQKPPVIDPAWLKWKRGTVKRIASSIHQDKSWAQLPILADALEEAGCSDAFVLDHLRAGRRHARSCWVTYLLLDV